MFGSLFSEEGAPARGASGGGAGAFPSGRAPAAGLDLNREEHAAELEDATLQARMEEARRGLADFHRRQAALVPAPRLAAQETEMSRELSALLVGLARLHRDLQTASDAAAVAAGHAAELARGGTPHGFPPPDPEAPGAPGAFLAKRLAAEGRGLDALALELAELTAAATRARRACEGAVAGFRERGAFFEGEVARRDGR